MSTRYHAVSQSEEPSNEGVELDENDQWPELERETPSEFAYRKPTVLWLLAFFLVNSLAFGLTAVLRINLVVSLVCRETLDPETALDVVVGGYNPQCAVNEINAKTAIIASHGNIIVGVLAAVTSTLLSKMSDRVGRIKIISCNIVGLILAESVLVCIAYFRLSYRWLYLAYGLDGISGSFALVMAMASAYVSDCTSEQQRAVQIGRIHGAMFIGISVGPLLSSWFSTVGGRRGSLLVFYICLTMRTMSLAYLRLVPESLPREALSFRQLLGTFLRTKLVERPTTALLFEYCKRISPFSWIDRLVPLAYPNSISLRSNVVLLLAINIVVYGGVLGSMDVLILYPQMVYKWGNVENNLFMSLVNAFRAAVSTLALPVMVKTFRYDMHSTTSYPESSRTPMGAQPLDRALICTAVLLELAGYVGYAVAPNGIIFTLCGALAAFGGIGLATTEAALTKHIDLERIGELMGGLGFLQALMRIVAPTAVNLVYAATVEIMPQIAFLGIAMLLGIGALLTMFLEVSV